MALGDVPWTVAGAISVLCLVTTSYLIIPSYCHNKLLRRLPFPCYNFFSGYETFMRAYRLMLLSTACLNGVV